ncbi:MULTISPECIES: C2 family cysteine protease [Giesbergeria]|uniref:C2 family cysteine protease n=1 Tax=Giesbergeria sinuosa TaxID=80883 RepID=A0ABV9QEP8_9BURK
MSATSLDQDISTVAYARHIGTAVLFVGTDGTWSVGRVGQKVSEYQSVKFNGQGGIHDDTFDVTALAAELREDGGYVLYLQANQNPALFFEATTDAQGNINGAKALSQAELFAAEVRYGIDLNYNGGLGDAMVLVDAGSVNLYLDGLGAYQLQQPDGSFRPLQFGGVALTLDALEGFEIETIVPKEGGYQIYVRDEEDNLFELGTDEAGSVDAGTFQTVGSAQLSELEQRLGEDINAAGDTPVAAGWTSLLKTAAVKAQVEALTANNAKINHAGLVKIVDAAIESVGGASNPIGTDLFSDLKAIAARGKELFTAPDLAGAETGYLLYVFNQLVNGSKANNFYTGGQTQTQTLGNLSANATANTLQKLEDKWLLGKDLPNPTTEGDTANPNAAAASGLYKAFSAELISGASAFDVNQGSAGTCYLLASMAAVAQVNPTALNSVFVPNGSSADSLQTWGVRFFDTNGKVHWVTANNQFVVKNLEDTETAYSKVKGVDAQGNPTQELWAPLLEKAYAQANELQIFGRTTQTNSMLAIEGGLAEAVVNVAGGKVTTFADEVTTYNGNSILQTSVVPTGSTALEEYTKAMNEGKVLFVVSQATTSDANGSKLFVPGHAYMAYDADTSSATNTTVKVYNPWGFSAVTAQEPVPSHLAPFDMEMAALVGTTGISLWMSV